MAMYMSSYEARTIVMAHTITQGLYVAWQYFEQLLNEQVWSENATSTVHSVGECILEYICACQQINVELHQVCTLPPQIMWAVSYERHRQTPLTSSASPSSTTSVCKWLPRTESLRAICPGMSVASTSWPPNPLPTAIADLIDRDLANRLSAAVLGSTRDGTSVQIMFENDVSSRLVFKTHTIVARSLSHVSTEECRTILRECDWTGVVAPCVEMDTFSPRVRIWMIVLAHTLARLQPAGTCRNSDCTCRVTCCSACKGHAEAHVQLPPSSLLVDYHDQPLRRLLSFGLNNRPCAEYARVLLSLPAHSENVSCSCFCSTHCHKEWCGKLALKRLCDDVFDGKLVTRKRRRQLQENRALNTDVVGRLSQQLSETLSRNIRINESLVDFSAYSKAKSDDVSWIRRRFVRLANTDTMFVAAALQLANAPGLAKRARELDADVFDWLNKTQVSHRRFYARKEETLVLENILKLASVKGFVSQSSHCERVAMSLVESHPTLVRAMAKPLSIFYT